MHKHKKLKLNISVFYKECIQIWGEVLSKEEILCREDILKQPLFGNIHISKESTPLFYKNWAKSNLKYVDDIWNVTANNFHSGNYIFAHLNVKTNWIAEFAKIKSLIPIRWKKILKGLNCVDKDDNLLKNPSNFSFNHSQILLNGQEIPQSKLKQKHLFYACLYPTRIPKCVKMWKIRWHM